MRGRKQQVQTDRKAVAYTRVSTQEQAVNGSSLEAQRNRLNALAGSSERTISEVYSDDGFSAGSLRRPALQRLLADVRSGAISAVYVAKLDRLSRSLRDLLELVHLFESHDVALVSASESLDSSTAAGRMLVHLLGTFAEFERGRISERICDVLSDKRRRRKIYSRRTPFGYRREQDRLVADPAQQRALETMKRMHSEGASLRQIASHLNRLGITSNSGKQFSAQTVKDVLTSRMTSAA